MIDGVLVTKLKIIRDERGSVMHMLRNDSPTFSNFGEIYFSTINHNSIKAWHLHKETTLNYSCIFGRVKLVLYDTREKSKTSGEHQELILSPEEHRLITIPKNIWNGFKGLEKNISIVANCLTLPHNEKEMVRKDPFDKFFKYHW
tara:strand:+ start:9 stop:443 length:435 start_codon:yes stop_codon:yes gene_type:complete